MTRRRPRGRGGVPAARSGRTSRPGGRLRRPLSGDDGNAVVEFVYLAILLMIPVVYVLLSVFDVQRTAFGVTEAARQAGRTWVTSNCDAERAQTAASLALRDQGVSSGYALQLPEQCPAPGGSDTVVVTAFVQLPGLGALLPAGRGGIKVVGSFVAARDLFAP